MSVGSVLKQLRLDRGLSVARLAKMVGVSHSTVLNWEEDRYHPRPRHLNRLSAIFGVSPAVFYAQKEAPRSSPSAPSALYLPVVSYVHAGVGYFRDPEELLLVTPEEASRADFVLKVKGESMLPTLQEGDYVGIKKQSTAASGDIVVATLDDFDEVTIKRFRKSGTDIELVPDNPEFPVYSSRQHRIRLIGIVTWLKRIFR
ncbi:MAG: XRE family transcriptional regulator [Armatimonadetes bacterium]|nr:XRE family transcriptional regulator [Armatimonadota bacterium]MDW8120685.1 XRE family transcriptional regulator [Armatimonadota bacterium]